MTSRDVAGAATTGVRRAELVAALSLALDLATGEPLQRSMRTCVVALRLAAAVGLPETQRGQVYYVSLLRWLGCTADAHEAARIFGDELAGSNWIHPFIGDGAIAVLSGAVRHHASGRPLPSRAAAVARLLLGMPRILKGMEGHCEVAVRLAGQMGFDGDIQDQLSQVYEVWDGSGMPAHLRGEAIALPVRLVVLADEAQLFARLGGAKAVAAMAGRRAGKTLDPTLCRVLGADATGFVHDLEEEATLERVVDLAPDAAERLDEAALEACLAAMGEFVDLKAPRFAGHSARVATLSAEAARRLRLPDAEVALLRRAALVHEIGLAGISAALLERTRLAREEEERLRLHTYYTERVLARPPALAALGALAGLHHELLDATGYHRGLPAASQPAAARILAAACRFDSARCDGLDAGAEKRAAAEVEILARDGKLDRQAVEAVLACLGRETTRSRPDYPAGLSEREVEVLRLLARGLSRKEVARELVIADKTVARHIEHIYDKIGVNTRPAAAIFAMQHNLL